MFLTKLLPVPNFHFVLRPRNFIASVEEQRTTHC